MKKNMLLTVFILFTASLFATNVTFTVVDDSWLNENIKIKGTMSGWALVQAYDDGTNGDTLAGDHVWTAIYDAAAGDHEWGAINDDGTNETWLIEGSNIQFSVSSSGDVTGTTSYTIPAFTADASGSIKFTVTDGTESYADIEYKGTATSWALVQMYDDGTNGDATSGDHVWTVIIDNITAGDHEWGAIEHDGTNEIWLITGSNRTFTLDADLLTYHGQTFYEIPAPSAVSPVTFTVTDSSWLYENIKIKGTMSSWALVQMYDDGTNGDTLADDHIWTAIYDAATGDHEWGAIEDDGSEWGIWLIEGSNIQFSVSSSGDVTGTTSYTIPAFTADAAGSITFTVTDGTESYADIEYKGTATSWALVQMYDDGTNGGDTLAGDHVWTVTIDNITAGDHEWGAIEHDGTNEIWLISGSNRTFTLDADLLTYHGQTFYKIPVPSNIIATVTFLITDEGNGYQDIEVKGNFNNWTLVQAYDDGTNGDVTSGDGIWTCVVDSIPAGSYEWGAIENDGTEWGIWLLNLIGAPNQEFTVELDSSVTGSTGFTIPYLGVPVTKVVLFSVDMTEWLDEDDATGLPIFSVARNDTMFIRGSINGWGSTDRLIRTPGKNVFSAAIEQTGPDILTQEYKYYLQHSTESQTLLEATYGASFFSDMGWEDSPQFGGGNRTYILGADDGTGLLELPMSGYYDLPAGAVVPADQEISLTFSVDMTGADTVGFNATEDTVRLELKDKWLNFTQRLGDNSSHVATANGDGTYSVTIDFTGPIPWHMIYTWEFYDVSENAEIQEGGGFATGRYRARYFHSNSDRNCVWEDFSFPQDTWKKDPPLLVEGYDPDAVCIALEVISDVVPAKFQLADNYPNPFNPTTNISFSIPMALDVHVNIYNVLGQRVATFNEGLLNAGTYNIRWNGRDQMGNPLASGIYFYELQAGDQFKQIKKMTFVK